MTPVAHPFKKAPCFQNPFKESIREYFDQIAPQLDQWSNRNRYYYRDIEELHQFLVPAGKRVLEVGCGTGDLLAAVAPATGVGIDFSEPVLEIARSKYPHLSFHCLDAETFLVSDLERNREPAVPFDFILLSLGYLGDIQAVLQQLHPFCNSQTRVILTFYNFFWGPLLHFAEIIGQRRPQPPQNWLSMGDVENLLAITGYEPIKLGRRCLFPKAIPGISKVINRYLGPLPLINSLCLTSYVVARPLAHIPPPALRGQRCSVIIPARNEAGNIRNAIARLPHLGEQTEVIFVEGHSQDETWGEIQQVLQEYQGHLTIKALQQTGKGKADAVRLGFAKATGDILMILDADLTVPPEDLQHFWDVIVSGQGEFINGSRLVYPRSTKAMPWLNTVANKVFALLFSFLLGQPMKDTLCGTKVLWREDYLKIAAGRDYFGDFDPFGDFDLLFGAAKLNLHIVEVPVRYQSRSYGQSNIAHFREGLILLKMCLYASQKLKFL